MDQRRDERQRAAVARIRPLVEERGYDNVSVDAMAAAAGVSKATFYRIFPAKAGVRAALGAAGVAPERLDARAGREALLDAATVAFGAHGYAEATVDAIAQAAGMSKAGFYWHFASKDALFAAVVARYAPFDTVARVIADGEARGDTLDAVLRAVLATVGAALAANRALFRAIFFEATRNPEIGALFARHVIGQGLGMLAGYLMRQMAAGRIRPLHPTLAVQGLIGPLFLYLFTQELFAAHFGLAVSLDEVVAQVVGTFLNGALA